MVRKHFKNIVITGASSGIGAEMAIQLADKNVRLCLIGRNEDRLSEVTEHCVDRGAIVTQHIIDVRDRDLMAKMLIQEDDEVPFDLIVASAGIGKRFEDAEYLRQTTEVNVMGVLNTIEPLLQRLIAREKGQIALLSSLAGFRTLGGPAGYTASKAWVRLYGEALRGQMVKHNVGVSVICPGFVDTPMVAKTPKKIPRTPVYDAAVKIIDGLENNTGRIVFPRKHALIIWFVSALPSKWAEHLFMKKMEKF